jgi:O-antigen/teichoic acid export membrane protein
MDSGRRPTLKSSGRAEDGQAPPPATPLSDTGERRLEPALEAASTAGDVSSSRAVRSGAFTLGGHVTVQALRMGGQIILTRLLPQEAFGLMAIVHTFRALIDLFTDVGIGPSIIQNERGDDPRFLDTAWTIQAGRGLILFGVACIASVPVARFYGHQELSLLIPAASSAALIAGVRATKAYSAERHMVLGWPTLIEIIAQCSALVVMVTWALLSPSVWALVAGALVGASVDVLLGHLVLPGHRGGLGWDKSAVRSLMRFGRWIFISTVLTFIVNEADRLIFGKMISLADLGVYNVALTIATIPSSAMHSLAGKVIFPLFSRVNETGEHLAAVFRKARQFHLVLSGWALSGLMGGGQAAIGLIYDAKYASGGWMLQLLALSMWFAAPEATNSSASLACGHPRWVAAANLAKLVGMLVLLPLGYHYAGFRGALIAYAMTELFRYVASTIGVYRRGLPTASQDLQLSGVVLVSALSAWGVVRLLEARRVHVALQALVVFVLVTVIWGYWLAPYVRDMLRRIEARRAR